MYALNVLSLWLKQKINFRTVVHAFKNRPTAVAGRVIVQSRAQGVSVFFKQWGGRRADKGGCAIGGVEFKEFPLAA